MTGPAFSPPGRVVVLSPHCDDAVWSLGGAIAEWVRRTEVLVIVVFDGDPPAEARAAFDRQPGHAWRGLESAALRRREDAAALDLLGAHRIGLGWPEAAFRCRRDGSFAYPSMDAVLAGSTADAGATPEPTAWLTGLHRHLRANDTLVAPLGVGGHADHRIVHFAVSNLPMPRGYYAEFPYHDPARPDQIVAHLARLGIAAEPLQAPCDWPRWRQAALRYRSQVLRMFGSAERFCDALAACAGADVAQPSCRIWSTRAR